MARRQRRKPPQPAVVVLMEQFTQADYDRLLVKQEGLCAVCRQKETRRIRGKVIRLSVDHDHDTGRVRGLLCGSCNVALGLLGDDQATIEALARYHACHEGAGVVR